MTSIVKFAYATLLAITALNFAPSLASAQESAHGKFTLTHEVYFGNAKVSAGDYVFSFDPDTTTHMLTISKTSGARASYLVLVPSTDDTKPSDLSRLVLERTPKGIYVSAMQLPEFGMTLNFNLPSRTSEKQIAKTAITAAALGQ